MSTRDNHIDIEVDQEHIAGTVITPDARLPGVLFVHGWGGSQQQYLARARRIAALGCVCLTFDLRGHAQTYPQQNIVSRESSLADVLAAYDVLARHPMVDPSAIAVVGSSYGGYLGAILTSLRRVKWLVLRVPALYMDSGWDTPKKQLHVDQDLETYRSNLVPAKENRALRACSEFRGDVLVVESEKDDIIPHAVISSYLDAFIKPHSMTYRVINGADHGLTDDTAQKAYTALLCGWMSEMLAGELATDITPVITESPDTLPEAPPQPV